MYFRIGQKVKVVKGGYGVAQQCVGQIVTISDFKTSNGRPVYAIDEDLDACNWISEKSFEPMFKVGDKVKFIVSIPSHGADLDITQHYTVVGTDGGLVELKSNSGAIQSVDDTDLALVGAVEGKVIALDAAIAAIKKDLPATVPERLYNFSLQLSSGCIGTQLDATDKTEAEVREMIASMFALFRKPA